jgi:hypothetical protein
LAQGVGQAGGGGGGQVQGYQLSMMPAMAATGYVPVMGYGQRRPVLASQRNPNVGAIRRALLNAGALRDAEMGGGGLMADSIDWSAVA